MRRWRRILLVLLAVLLLVPSGVAYWVATTESGLRFLVKRLHKVGPVTLTFGEITGTLTEGIRIASLRVEHRLADIRVEEAQGRVELLPLLLRRQIVVPDFSARHVSILQIEDPVQRPRRMPRFLPAMLRIDAEAARVESLDLTLKNGRLLTFRNISGASTLLPQEIRARGAEADWEDWRFKVDGRLLAARPYGLDGDFTARWRPPGQPEWQLAGEFDGNLEGLPLTAEVSEPFLASIQGNAVLQSDWQVKGRASVRDFDLTDFGGTGALGLMTGELEVAVDRDGITAEGSVTPPGLEAGAFNVDFNGRYEDRVLRVRQTVLVHPPSGTRATVRGTVTLEPGGPRLALGGEWTQLRWPLVGPEAAFTSAQGNYILAGVKPWQVQAAGEIVAADLPPMPGTARGRLGGESFQIDEATLQLFGGEARFTGEAHWQPAESWQVQGHMSGFDPSQLREDLDGKLDFDFQANGAPFGDEGSINFTVASLRGELRGQPASGSGRFTRAGGSIDWNFHDVDIALGTARAKLDGHLGEQPDLSFTVQASDLGLLHPEARGTLEATGRYAGTPQAPLLKLKASGGGFEWQDYAIEKLTADLDIDLTSGSSRAEGTASATGVKVGARRIDSTSISLTGSGEQQRLALEMNAAPLSMSMAALGGIRDGLWQGQLTGLTLNQTDRFTLRNETPAPLSFNLKQAELGQVCLRGTPERVCLSGGRLADGTWNAAFSADALPLDTFTAGLSNEFAYDGTINVRGELAGQPGMLPTGGVQGELMGARLRHRLGNNREEVISLGTGTVSATATTSAFSFQVALDADQAGSIRGRIDGERLRSDWRDYPIRGSLNAQTDGLSLLDVYIGEIDKASGRLETQVSIAGTLGTPTLQGSLQLRDAAIDIYRINLALRELSVDARFNTNALDFSGQTNIANQPALDGSRPRARFNGRLTWRDGLPYGSLHLEGERLRVVDVPEARIEASPNLEFRIEGRSIDATGEVLVPYGRIVPADLTTAVLASGDEELVGAPAVDPAQRWAITSDIRLQLGDDVRIETFGLDAKLGGALRLRTDIADNRRAQGELTVSDGKYAALGRQLDIESGGLIYNNALINDPGIELRAQKVLPDNTIVGVLVRGTLRSQRLTFYSEPQLPPSQIALLITAGGSIESLSNSQAPGAARNDLLAQGGAILAQRVGSQVGIDAGIESDRKGLDTSLVLGKYLSDRIYISYGISLTEAINTLKLRFTLSERWSIRTEAGKERAADIVFTLRK